LQGCTHCGGRLHVAGCPRKPRGCALDELRKIRLSFCCATIGTFPWTQGLSGCDGGFGDGHATRSQRKASPAVDRTARSLSTDAGPLASVVAQHLPGQSLLAGQPGSLPAAGGGQTVTRYVVRAIRRYQSAASSVSVVASAGAAQHDVLVRLFEGGNQSAEDVIALHGNRCVRQPILVKSSQVWAGDWNSI